MSTHVINLEIRRFYRVYVSDPANNMSEAELIEKAKQLAVEDENCLDPDPDLEIEPHDILCGSYDHQIEDGDDDDDEPEVVPDQPVSFRYYMPYRPPMPGAMPRDGIVRMYSADQREKVEGCQRPVWGWVEYDHELTAKEINDYELIPQESKGKEDEAGADGH